MGKFADREPVGVAGGAITIFNAFSIFEQHAFGKYGAEAKDSALLRLPFKDNIKVATLATALSGFAREADGVSVSYLGEDHALTITAPSRDDLKHFLSNIPDQLRQEQKTINKKYDNKFGRDFHLATLSGWSLPTLLHF